jgi:hypothetical protein
MEGEALGLFSRIADDLANVNSVCPGFLKTDIARTFSMQFVLHFFYWMKAIPTYVSANTLVLLGTTTPEQHGEFHRPYFTDEQYAKWGEKRSSPDELY